MIYINDAYKVNEILDLEYYPHAHVTLLTSSCTWEDGGNDAILHLISLRKEKQNWNCETSCLLY